MKRALPYLLLLLTMLFWAANFHLVKIALEYYSPMGVASWRFLFAIITLGVILLIQYGKDLFALRYSRREWVYLFWTAFLGIFLTIYFFNAGLKTTSAVNGSLIIATTPAITAILSYIFIGQKVTAVQWLAISLSFFGVLLILIMGDFRRLWQLQFVVGDIYILMMALVFSASQIVISKYLFHFDSIIMTSICSLIALVLFVLSSYGELMTNSIPDSWPFWGSILFMGIFGTGVSYAAFYFCVVQLGATTASLFINLIPLFTVLLAIPFGERMQLPQFIGGSIIISGLLLFRFAKNRASV